MIKRPIHLSHDFLAEVLDDESVAVDATMGNGNDTAFLAGLAKKVYAFDVQEQALEKTRQRLSDLEIENAELILDGHENLDRYVTEPIRAAIFNLGYLPVAVALEGNFDSDFANRMTPKGMANVGPLRDKSLYARQIVVADGDIIRNETPPAGDSTVIPLGYDRYMNQQFGNKDFVLNSVLYLTDDDGWMELRNRTLKLRLLNKHLTDNDRLFWQLINVVLPVLILLLFGALYLFFRKRKYTR
jgi:hypothetical protein